MNVPSKRMELFGQAMMNMDLKLTTVRTADIKQKYRWSLINDLLKNIPTKSMGT